MRIVGCFKEIKWLVVATLLLLVATKSLEAQDKFWHPTYQNYTTVDGLPSMETYSSLEDSSGYLWIASDRGAVRYNGHSFRTFTTKDGLVSNTIFDVVEDNRGRIWFGSNSPKLCFYEAGEIRQYQYNHLLDSMFPAHHKYTMLSVVEEQITVSSFRYGAFSIDANGKVEKLVESPDDEDSVALKIVVKEGNLLQSNFRPTKRNMLKYIVSFQTSDSTQYEMLQVGQRTQFVWNEKHSTAIANGKRDVCVFTPDSSYKQIFQRDITGIYSKGDDLWIGFLEGGVKHFNLAGDPNSDDLHLFHEFSISSVRETSDGGLWFTSLNNGIFHVRDQNIKRLTTNQHRNVPIHSIAFDHNQLYIQDQNTHVSVLDPASLETEKTYDLIASSFGLVTVPGDHGVIINKRIFPDKRISIFKLVRNDSVQLSHRTSMARVARYSNDGTLVFGNPQGLEMIGNRRFQQKILGGVRALELINDQQVWIGNFNGTYILDLETGNLSDPSDQRLMQRMNDIVKTPHGVYYASHGNGLFVFTDSLQHFTTEHGLKRDFIDKIKVGKAGTMWLMSHNGITHVRVIDGKLEVLQDYSSNLLQSEKLIDVAVTTNYIYLATNNGMLRIAVQESNQEHQLPLLYINEFLVNAVGRRLNELELSHTENNITIHFDAVSFAETPVQFRYRLAGSEEWIQTTQRTIFLRELPYGDYQFELQAANEGQAWTPSQYLSFVIMPPIWARLWFQLCLIAIGIGLIFSIVRWQLLRLKRKNELHRRIIELQQRALTRQMNPHFVYNAMGSLQNSILKGDVEKANDYIIRFSRLLRLGLDASRSELISVRADMELLQSYLTIEQTRLRDGFTFEVKSENIELPEQLLISPFLLQPFVENSVKHGVSPRADGGHIAVAYRLEKDHLMCSIEDDGVGFAATEQSDRKSYGSSIAFERAALLNQLHGRELVKTVEHKVDEMGQPCGTKVIIALPIIKK